MRQVAHIGLVARKGDGGWGGSVPIALHDAIHFDFGAICGWNENEVVQTRGRNAARNHVFGAEQIFRHQLIKASILGSRARILFVVVPTRGHRDGLGGGNARPGELIGLGDGGGVGLPGLQGDRHLVGPCRVEHPGRKRNDHRGIGLSRHHGDKAHGRFRRRIGRDNFCLVTR